MACYFPKRKTASGVEDVKLSIDAVNGLRNKLTELTEQGERTVDKISYLSVTDSEVCEEIFNTEANAYLENAGFSYNTVGEIVVSNNDSETSYFLPVTLHIPIIAGENIRLSEENNRTAIAINAEGESLNMPIIRLAAVADSNNTMCISPDNPLQFTVEVISGSLAIGDELQICTRQLYTYKNKNKRKYKLRSNWKTEITEQNVNDRFLFVSVAEAPGSESQRLFKTNSASKTAGTLSALYIRIRRPIFVENSETAVDAKFSNIITVWKRYDRSNGQVLIK